MLEISANDLAAMDARQTPEGMTYRFAAREDANAADKRGRGGAPGLTTPLAGLWTIGL